MITEKNDKWYANLICNYNLTKDNNNGWVGLDMGLINLIVDSLGNKFKPLKILIKYLGKLKKENRRLSKKKFRSSNWKKQKIVLSKLHEKISELRKDFLHKLSNDYVEKYKYIVVEDLNIKEMVEKKDINGNKKKRVVSNKNVIDASWNMFINMLDYKLKQSGGELIKVDPKNTTQTCSKCGNIKEGKDKLTCRDRIYKCKCGLELDRDYNAALNILQRGKELFNRKV